MNCTTYMFGVLSSGYTQFPEDSASLLFKGLYSSCKAESQIIICRDESIMYYCYVRKLVDNKYIGLSVAVNGYYINSIENLFAIFESTIEKLAEQGDFIHFMDDGRLDGSISQIGYNEEEIISICDYLKLSFQQISNTKKLPAVDFSVARNSNKNFDISENESNIIKASYTYGKTFIYKSQDIDTIRVNSYKSVLARITNENTELKKQNEEILEENRKVKQQKKQIKNVILLVLLVIGCGIGLLLLNGSLNNTKSELYSAKNEISELNIQMSDLNEELDVTKTSLKTTKDERDKVQLKLNDFKDKVGSSMPIIITNIQIANTTYGGDIETDYGNTIYSSSTMYLKPKISYIGIKTGGNINLNIKLYTPSGLSTGSSSPSGYSYSTSMYVYSGNNTEKLASWGGSSRGHWSSGTYRFEIWYGDVCLKSKSFTVY